ERRLDGPPGSPARRVPACGLGRDHGQLPAPRVVPGNPVAGAVARASQSGNCNEQCVLAIELQLGYNVHTSLWDQYTQYLGNLAHGDLGHSWSQNAPVASLIVSYLPWTLVLLGIPTTIARLRGRPVRTRMHLPR